MATNDPGRLHALDSLRATAMFLGIVLHGAGSFAQLPVPWPVRDSQASQSFLLMEGLIHLFRMQLFFLLAGFFAHLVWQRAGTREFLVQRSRRIGLPFLLGMFTIVPLVVAIWLWAETITGATFMQRRMANPVPSELGTAHLWFLEMLMVFYLAVAAIAWAAKYIPGPAWAARIDAGFDWLMAQRLKPLLLLAPTVLLMWGGPAWGEVDQAGMRFIPAARAFAYYGIFFFVGWWLHRRLHLLELLQRWLALYFVLAALAFFTMGACLQANLRPSHPSYTAVKLLALTAAALYAWCMTFALTGLFLRFAGAPRAWKRYLADASYWCYLWHLPLVMWLQVVVAPWQINGWLKLAGILACSTALLLASYQLLVRYTWIGRMLNGPRERAGGAQGRAAALNAP